MVTLEIKQNETAARMRGGAGQPQLGPSGSIFPQSIVRRVGRAGSYKPFVSFPGMILYVYPVVAVATTVLSR